MPLVDGGEFGPYTILGRLGRGGMASVYRAVERKLDREVALKVLPEELVETANFVERFEREAKVIARLEHPSIVPLYAYGIDEHRPWMALRLVRGGHLGDLLERGDLDRSRGLALFAQLAAALDHAHAHGIIHRDLKPQNVLIDTDGNAYLADFGIARLLENATALTATGAAIGTPQYMSPEQAEGKLVGPETDVYALAVICYRWLAGSEPFVADTPLAVLLKHLQAPVPLEPLAAHGEAVTRVLVKALAKQAEERYASASDFLAALSGALATHSDSGPAATRLAPVDGIQPETAVAAGVQAETVADSASLAANSGTASDSPPAPTALMPSESLQPQAVSSPLSGSDWLSLSFAGLVAASNVLFATFAVLLSDFRSEDYLILACFGGFGVGLSWLVLRCLRAKPTGAGSGLRLWCYSAAYLIGGVTLLNLSQYEPNWGDTWKVALFLLVQGVGAWSLIWRNARARLLLPGPSLGAMRWIEWSLLALGAVGLAIALSAEPESRRLDPPVICLWSVLFLVAVERSLFRPRSGAISIALLALSLPGLLLTAWFQKNQINISAMVELSVFVAVLYGLLTHFDRRAQ